MNSIHPFVSLASLALFVSSTATIAQTAPKPAATHRSLPAHTAASTPATAACAKLDVSPTIPALPPGASCKPLITFMSEPAVKLSYVSPMVTPEVRESLGLTPSTFSLDYSDIKVGTGALALPQRYYTVNYTGYLTDGTKFDSSLDTGKPFTFPIGAHRVIVGWDLGLQGMHVGGKRRLFIPWQLAYGDRGKPPTIPAKAELIFDIELISQSETDPTAAAAPATTQPATTQPATPKPATQPATPPAAPPAATPAATPPKP